MRAFLCGALLLFGLSSLVALQTRPYQFSYPANFGGRFFIPEDNPTTEEGVYLGRLLFYEKRLSADNSLSCGSCHIQKLAFTDGLPFSKGVDGTFTSRNAMSLANLLWVRNFFWDGRAPGLEAQATFPMTDPHEMGQPLSVSVEKLKATALYPELFKAAFGTSEVQEYQIRKALAQFERSLISADSKYDHYLAGKYIPTASEQRGMKLFATSPDPERGVRGANCEHCHGGPKTFKELFHNNGLDLIYQDSGRQSVTGQADDHGRFRVPTLRNIALTAPYMHDGRFDTLEEVLDHYSDHVKDGPALSSFIRGVSNVKRGGSLALNDEEKADIISFLHMLTDSSFIKNPRFSDPGITIR